MIVPPGGWPDPPEQRALPESPEPEAESQYDEVRCPLCLGMTRWDGHTVYDVSGAEVDLNRITNPLKRAEVVDYARVKCTAPEEDFGGKHYLPIDYVRWEQPLVIGFIGGSETGKSTLLTAMVREIDRGGLAVYGLESEPLDRERHREFELTRIEPLFGRATAHDPTPRVQKNVQFVDAFRITHAGGVRPVAFFDVGGEGLRMDEPGVNRFLYAVEALIFVADPALIEKNRQADGFAGKDGTFQTALDRIIRVRREQAIAPPAAAVVLAKSDMRRFDPVVERWLGREARDGLDPDSIRAESRDVYAFLYRLRATPWLYPVSRCRPCTLHFVSATSGSARMGDEDVARYQRGVRPRRVLEPLAAILAMSGVIDAPGADRVGR